MCFLLCLLLKYFFLSSLSTFIYYLSASSSCVICQKTSTQLSHPIPEDDSFKAAYEFGLSPLHARIRFMEHITKLGYDLDFGPLGETVRKNMENEEKRKQRKQQIQEKYLELGLMIDQPKQGQGNTNDKNTVRKFFQIQKLQHVSQILICPIFDKNGKPTKYIELDVEAKLLLQDENQGYLEEILTVFWCVLKTPN